MNRNTNDKFRSQKYPNNSQTHQREGLDGLDLRILDIVGENARTVSAGDLLIPNKALTLENLYNLFEAIGWGPRLSDESIIIDVSLTPDVSDDDPSVRIRRYPSGLRLFMDWYIRPEKSLEEKLRFINEQNIGLSGVSMAYLGMPMGNETIFTPQPGVVGAYCQLSALHGLSFNQITMGIHVLINSTLAVAGLAHNRSLLDEQRWPIRYVEAMSDVVKQCESFLSQPNQE